MSTPRRQQRRPDWSLRADRGSAVIEIVVLAPVLVAFVAMVIFGGRWAIAGQAVQSAAADAARAASIARTPTDAATDATSAAMTSLSNQQVRCATQDVAVDTTGFTVRVGRAATVSVTLSCVVDMGDLALPGVPGTTRLSSTMTSPLDTHRSRQG